MKISLEWLREYVDYREGPEKLADLFMNVGLPVETCEPVGGDWVLDVEVTSNRSDCLGHIGLAREVAAVTGAALKLPSVAFSEQGKEVAQWTSVVDEAAALCPRYTARIIDGVKVAPSPDWMRRRLETVGVRSISNVVDVTNYVMMEVGQPLHTFDYARLEGGRIVVRLAKPGEQMTTIDHSRMELKDKMLVIADAAQPAALAGIMGGLASEVTENTRTVLLESAHFEPLCIRSTSRALALGSESSYRFERNVDMAGAEWASRRAAALLAEVAGGKVAPGVIDVWPGKKPLRQVSLRLARLKALLGIEVDRQFVITVLERLGFAPRLENEGVVSCTVPSWRGDVYREVDLIEEIIRIQGYHHLPTEHTIHIAVKTADPYQRARQKVTTALNGSGFYETVNVGFVEDRHWQAFVEAGFEPLRVKDISRKGNSALRPSVLPSLMSVRQRNKDAGNGRCDLYELAAVHQPKKDDGLPIETIMLGLVTDGDFRELRGAAEAVVASVDKQAQLVCRPAEILWSAQGAGAQLCVGDKVIGWAGKANESIRKLFDLEHDVCLAEIRFEALVNLQGRAVQLQPLLRFPPIERDLSLVVDEALAWADIAQAINDVGIADLRDVRFVDIYRGKGIDAGKKSLTLSLEFRRAEETLTHEQVDAHQAKILAVLAEKFAAVLRA